MQTCRSTEMDNYSDFILTSRPDVSAATLCELKQFTPEELASSLAKTLRKYSCAIGGFVQDSRISCIHYSHRDWDHHFQDELNNAFESTSLNKFNSCCQPVEKLLRMGWSLLSIYELDVEKNKPFLSSLVGKLLNQKLTKKSQEFLDELCGKIDKLQLPLSLFEAIVNVLPLYIENLIVDLLHHSSKSSKSLTTGVPFQRPDVAHWLKSCSQSPKLFQISVAVINSLLLRSRGARVVARFVQQFLSSVKLLLPENSSVAALYPRHLQGIVASLDETPQQCLAKWKVTKRDEMRQVLESLMDGLARDRYEYLCLLSHFPLWMLNLFQFAVIKGEARVFSNYFAQQDCLPYSKRLAASKHCYDVMSRHINDVVGS